MFKRKTVIFQIGKENKIVSEFNENITIFYLKIYIRDRTNIKNFDLYFKGNRIKNNHIPLYKFLKDKKDKEINFFLKVKNNKGKLKANNKENINIFTNEQKNQEKLKLYEKEILSIKEENNQLINNINKYKENINECLKKENKNKEKYNSIENLLIKQKEEIKLLRNEINEANIKYKTLRNKSIEKENNIKKSQLNYTKSNDSFAIISKIRKPTRCLSVESFNTFFPIQKNIKNNHSIKTINLATENLKNERNSFDSSNINSSMDYNNNNIHLKISTNNISNINNNKKIINNNNINNINNISNYNRNSKTDLNSINFSNYSDVNKDEEKIKFDPININNINNIDKESENEINSIKINNNINKENKNELQEKEKINNINDIKKMENNSISINNNINKDNKNKIDKSKTNDITNNIENNGNDSMKINRNIKCENKNELDSININNINNINNSKISRNEKIKFKNNNNNELVHSSYSEKIAKIKYQFEIKEHNINNNNLNEETKNNNLIQTSKITADSIEITKEEDEIDFNKIINEFKKNNKNNKRISKESLLNNDSLKIPELFDKYFTVFKFLNDNEILNYSLINKSNGVCSLFFWMNYLENKINYLNDNYNKLSSRYNSLLEKLITAASKSTTILSHFSRSGLRVLNSPHYLDILNKPVDYFTKDNIFLFIFKMLFAFIKLYDSNSNISDNEFISFMLNEIKSKNKKTLREYIYNIIDKEMDFSFDTSIKAKNIMKFYNIENIEGNQLSKVDRASTIIGYVIKDIMIFTGLTIKTNASGGKNNTGFGTNNIKTEEDISFNNLKNKIINTCEMINSEKNKCEKVFKKIKEVILKLYKI